MASCAFGTSAPRERDADRQRDIDALPRTRIAECAEPFERTPETLWQVGSPPNAHQELVRAFVQRCGRPAVGHGVSLSIVAASPPPRRWLAPLRRDRAVFDLRWHSQHLGFVDTDGHPTARPLPLPPTDEAVAAADVHLLLDLHHAFA